MLMYMPYGKHQGRLMTEVPRDNGAWLLGAGNQTKTFCTLSETGYMRISSDPASEFYLLL